MPLLQESASGVDLASCSSSGTPCAGCAKRNGAAVPAGTIHGYGSQPRSGWVPRFGDGEPETVPTFGIELETTVPYDRTGRHLTGDEAVAVAAPRGMWHSQHDGSVSGPELASQPATLAYWQGIRPSVANMMRTLVHGGVRAHDGGESCSMHVNIGRDGFADAAHLARFIRLATVNPRWSTRMAQRTHAQVASWARFDAFRDMAVCESFATQWWRNGYAPTGHGAAVNLENDGRVEFRVPRGTLRVDRFFGKLQWVAAMVEFTRDAANRPTVGAFCAWVLGDRSRWTDLVSLMSDVTPARVDPSRATSPAGRTAASRATDPSAGVPMRESTGTFMPCNDLHPSERVRCWRSAGHYGVHEWERGQWSGSTSTIRPATDPADLMTDANGVQYTETTARFASSVCADSDYGLVCERCGTGWGSHYGMYCAARTDDLQSVWLARR